MFEQEDKINAIMDSDSWETGQNQTGKDHTEYQVGIATLKKHKAY